MIGFTGNTATSSIQENEDQKIPWVEQANQSPLAVVDRYGRNMNTDIFKYSVRKNVMDTRTFCYIHCIPGSFICLTNKAYDVYIPWTDHSYGFLRNFYDPGVLSYENGKEYQIFYRVGNDIPDQAVIGFKEITERCHSLFNGHQLHLLKCPGGIITYHNYIIPINYLKEPTYRPKLVLDIRTLRLGSFLSFPYVHFNKLDYDHLMFACPLALNDLAAIIAWCEIPEIKESYCIDTVDLKQFHMYSEHDRLISSLYDKGVEFINTFLNDPENDRIHRKYNH